MYRKFDGINSKRIFTSFNEKNTNFNYLIPKRYDFFNSTCLQKCHQNLKSNYIYIPRGVFFDVSTKILTDRSAIPKVPKILNYSCFSIELVIVIEGSCSVRVV